MKIDKTEGIPVLLVTSKGGSYGMGHYNRMMHLTECLKNLEINSKLKFIHNHNDAEEYADSDASRSAYKVIVLDSRDDEFPELMNQQKLSGQFFLAVDNRGAGRSQADYAWDTLPHPAMNHDEFKRALKNCILNPSVIQFSGQQLKGKIIRCQSCDLESGRYTPDLVQYPLKNRPLSTPLEFLERLIQAESVATYFGQTLFDALYLGKTVYLYDISEYHRELADWFSEKVFREPELICLLDGQGLHHLALFIRSIVKEAPDFSEN